MKYPTRCQILDVTGQPVLDGRFSGAMPEASKPHVGKFGTAYEEPGTIELGDDKVPFTFVRIELDDGSVLWGHDCWWRPVEAAPEGAPDAAR